MNKIFFLVLSIALLSSCFKTYECPPARINVTLTGYDSLSIDTVILKEYTSDNNFTNLLNSDTIIVQYLDNWKVENNIQFRLFERININSDWEIKTSNNNYKINAFSYVKKTIRRTAFGCIERNCVSPINQCYINNNLKMLENELNSLSFEK